MGTYLLRRLLTALPVLMGISVVLFTLLALAPGDPFSELATNPNVPPEVRMNLRKQFGLDDPIALRYVRWFSSMVQGDWGFSFVSRVNVNDLFSSVWRPRCSCSARPRPWPCWSRFRSVSSPRDIPTRSSTRR
jgi:ABC-type dipeptide/oligopeptide/nickel transport system permease component